MRTTIVTRGSAIGSTIGSTRRGPVPCGVRAGRLGMRIGLGVAALGIATGCLSRPAGNQQPTLKANFTKRLDTPAIDKVDLLFAIDNSGSMGDKQELLKLAVPDLVGRLVHPRCLADADKRVVGTSVAGDCSAFPGSSAEFRPITDIHVGVVSSSLGAAGSRVCAAAPHGDDRGHLLARTVGAAGEGRATSATESNFLGYFPSNEANDAKAASDPAARPSPAIEAADALIGSFQDVVGGVQESGCGFEQQLESVYRFMSQPDPYAYIVAVAKSGDLPVYDVKGVDGVLLEQRKDFLRPDSLVAVIMLTDENDSGIDPLALGGIAPRFYQDAPLWRGTAACTRPSVKDASGAFVDGPMSAGCRSCGEQGTADDPECKKGAVYPAEDDNFNLRAFAMKRRFGLDAQYPIDRYVKGFSSLTVPNRNGEHPPADTLNKRTYGYRGVESCTNPLFAASLPGAADALEENIDSTLCKLPLGQRSPSLVYFAVIGGAPWQLLVDDPNAADLHVKSELVADDWSRLLGADPARYVFDGADPHMLESATPRAGLEAPAPYGRNGSDPLHGREWTSDGSDLMYACTFDLKTPKDCSKASSGTCDCHADAFNPNKDVPLCAANPADGGKPTLQVRGKAYPTIREFSVARALGKQGIVGSLCPIKSIKDTPESDPLYGYRPAVRSIVDRLAVDLACQGLPQPLPQDTDGNVPCLVLEWSTEPGGCDPAAGREDVDPAVRQKFVDSLRADRNSGIDAATPITVCRLSQLLPWKDGSGDGRLESADTTCDTTGKTGWCYVTGKEAGACKYPQQLKFSRSAAPRGARHASIQCISGDGAPVAVTP